MNPTQFADDPEIDPVLVVPADSTLVLTSAQVRAFAVAFVVVYPVPAVQVCVASVDHTDQKNAVAPVVVFAVAQALAELHVPDCGLASTDHPPAPLLLTTATFMPRNDAGAFVTDN